LKPCKGDSETSVCFARYEQCDLQGKLQQFFNQVYAEESCGDSALSMDDKALLDKVGKSITRVNGHYQTALLWREDDVQLPTSRSNCLFQTSPANRLSAIRDSYDPSQWRYVNSKRNPADVASRAETSLHCHKAKMWFNGPEFLWKHRRYWPEMPGNMSSVADDDPAIKRNATTIAFAKGENCFLHELITYFSSWIKLIKVIAW